MMMDLVSLESLNSQTVKVFQSRNGAFGAQDTETPSHALFTIHTGGDMVQDKPKIEDYQITACNDLLQHQLK